MYQLNGEEHILAWLVGQDDPEVRQAMLDWLPELADDPEDLAIAGRNRPGVPVYIAEVPGIDTFVVYTVIDQYKTVMVLKPPVTLRYEDLPPLDDD